MTLEAYLAGSDKASNVRVGGFSLTERADGSQGFGSITFDDEFKELSVRGWMKVVVKETACITAPVIFSGYIGPRRYSRSNGSTTYKANGSRFIDCTLVDENVVLDIRLFTGNDAKRPAETHADRINWMLTDGAMVGLIEDTSLVNLTSPRPFDEADYKYLYPSNLLEDIASALGRTYFVYVDGATGDRGLFFDWPDASIGDCTLSLSNDLSDITLDANGNVTGDVYPVLLDAAADLDPSEVYAKWVLTYRNGTVIGNSTINETTFFEDSGLGYRGIHTESTRVGLESTARAFADRYLVAHGVEKETVTCATVVPKEKAGLIRAGQRIQGKFTHLDGFDDFKWVRISERQIKQLDETNEEYLIVLELHSRASGAIGDSGGAPGPDDFPKPPPPTSTHWYEGSLVFDDDNHAGGGGFGFAALPFTGTTTVACTNTNGASFDPDTTYTGHVEITSGTGTISGVFWALDTTATYPPNGGVIGIADGSETWDGSFTTPTILPPGTIGYLGVKAQPPDSQLVTVNWWFDPDGWEAPVDQPPAPAQPVGPETVTMSGADGTTAWPFADGSIEVFVDNTNQTGAITAQDGAAGTFTLGFTPTPTEVVTVYYQGR